MTTPNSQQGVSSSSSLSSFWFSLNGLLVLSGVLFMFALIAPKPQPCLVIITGEAVRISGCADPSLILAHINLAPWNGVKFPIS
ncbi:triple gene block protein 3 [Asparagus virus 3]|uniref:Movement protein TGBp3 n=1 Tax=Asparagus virus 3 TaxID=445435 RepID=Q8QXK6_9VIRU|nr:triple gene block protein 3 [Asparagus virus 3]CAC87089.1 triple gene block protein 3 [Asparagus virus 3]